MASRRKGIILGTFGFLILQACGSGNGVHTSSSLGSAKQGEAETWAAQSLGDSAPSSLSGLENLSGNSDSMEQAPVAQAASSSSEVKNRKRKDPMTSAYWFLGSIGVMGAAYGTAYLITGGDMNGNGIKDSEEGQIPAEKPATEPEAQPEAAPETVPAQEAAPSAPTPTSCENPHESPVSNDAKEIIDAAQAKLE